MFGVVVKGVYLGPIKVFCKYTQCTQTNKMQRCHALAVVNV